MSDDMYFGDGNGIVHAVEDGWQYDTGTARVDSSPFTLDGVVYFGDNAGTVHAIDGGTGDSIWTIDVSTSAIYGDPVVHEGTLYVASDMPALHAIDIEDVSTDYSVMMDGSSHGAAVVRDDKIWLGTMNGEIEVFPVGSDQRDMKISTSSAQMQRSIAVADRYVYGVGIDDPSTLYCFNISDGSEEWSVTLSSGWHVTAPSISGDYVYCTDPGKGLRKFDRFTGDQVWENDLGLFGNRQVPVIQDDVGYIATDSGRLFEFTLSEAGSNWYLDLSSGEAHELAAVDGSSALLPGAQGVHMVDLDGPSELMYVDVGTSVQTTPAMYENFRKATFSGFDPLLLYEFTGQVLDAEGNPVEGAYIEVAYKGDVLGGTKTDKNGEYDLGESKGPLSLSLLGEYEKELSVLHESLSPN